MIENIKILPDSLHVKFKNNIDDNFPNIIGLEIMQKIMKIGIKEVTKEKLLLLN